MLLRTSLRLASVTASAIALLATPNRAAARMTGCDAGGPGATSCSIEKNEYGCEVSCETGYYACCRDTGSEGSLGVKCECVVNGGQPGNGERKWQPGATLTRLRYQRTSPKWAPSPLHSRELRCKGHPLG